MRPRITPLLVTPDLSIRAVIEIIDQAPKQSKDVPGGIALVVSVEGVLVGVVSDGDIRRAVLMKRDLDAPVSTIMNTDPVTVPVGSSAVSILRSVNDQLAKRGVPNAKIEKLIVVDTQGRPVDIVSVLDLWRQSEIGSRPICVIGMGFVGLTLAVTFADVGFEVHGIEHDERVLNLLKNGEPHFFEKNLPSMLRQHLGSRLFLKPSIDSNEADVYIVSVGTPFREDVQEVDYRFLESSAEQIGAHLKVGDLIVLRSTVPVGTTREHFIPRVEKASGLKAGRDFSVAFAPERTVEGKALQELRSLPQVIGGFDERSSDLAARLFRTIAPTIVTVNSLEEAEMVKLINNSYRDVVFGFANQISIVCDQFGLSTRNIINAANEGYPRDRIAHASPGVGGICLRKDPFLFLQSARKVQLDAPLIASARSVNTQIPRLIADKVARFCEQTSLPVADAKIGILGVAFKGRPETTDVRGSTSLDVIRHLMEKGFGSLVAHDPLVPPSDLEREGLTPMSVSDMFRHAHAVLLLTNHHEYEKLDMQSLCQGHTVKYLFDGWHLFSPSQWQAFGIRYDAMGTDANREG